MGRATLVNLLLRNFISFDMYEQAGKLLDSIPEQFPSAISNNQFVRHLYYVGRVHAVNCEYGEAHQRLNVVCVMEISFVADLRPPPLILLFFHPLARVAVILQT